LYNSPKKNLKNGVQLEVTFLAMDYEVEAKFELEECQHHNILYWLKFKLISLINVA